MTDSSVPLGAKPANPAVAALWRVGTTALPFVVLAILWQILAGIFPPFLFPSLIEVFKRVFVIFSAWEEFGHVLATVGRILLGLTIAFVIGALFALIMVRSVAVERFISPILTFFQGIPALSWVVFAIIWFHGVEFRIGFIMVMTSLPAFTFQLVDALRSMSKDLFEMVLSFRPDRAKLFRIIILPSVLPGVLTAWKVNLGNAARVVVVAELVGATGGVGYALLLQQQLFDMTGALAWTLQLVFFVLIAQQVIAMIESWVFRYRAISERTI